MFTNEHMFTNSVFSWVNFGIWVTVHLAISNQTVQLVFFRLYLMLHTRIARFDVMDTVALFGNLGLELNKA